MGIYAGLRDIKSDIVDKLKNYIFHLHEYIGFLEEINGKTIHKSENTKDKILQRIATLQEYIKELATFIGEFEKKTDILQKNITTENIAALKSTIQRLNQYLVDIMAIIREKNTWKIPIEDTDYTRCTKISREFLLGNILISRRIQELLNNLDRYAAVTVALNSGKTIKDILGVSHIHKISVQKIINGKQIDLMFINKVDITTSKIHLNLIKKISMEQYIRNKCDVFIDANPQNKEKYSLIKEMTARQLEDNVLRVLFNEFMDVLADTQGKYVRNSIQKINIELVFSKSGGAYKFPSDSKEIFIEILLYTEILDAVATGDDRIDRRSHRETYNTIVHELGHSYDWHLNNNAYDDNTRKNTAEKIIGDSASDKDLMLVKILTACREEGLAQFAEISANIRQNGPMGEMKIRIYPIFKKEFQKIISQRDIPEDKFRATYYGSGIMHRIGELMTAIIFMHSTYEKISFEEMSRNILHKDVLKKLTAERIRKLMSETAISIMVKGTNLKEELSNFIKKLSLMPPEMFLEKYEEACLYFHLEPIISKYDFEGEQSAQKKGFWRKLFRH